jgi:hypothetical protein
MFITSYLLAEKKHKVKNVTRYKVVVFPAVVKYNLMLAGIFGLAYIKSQTSSSSWTTG